VCCLDLALAAFGITRAVLEVGQRQIGAVGAGDAARNQRKGTAQDEAMSTLDAWISAFLKIARMALQNQLQLLEKLGVDMSMQRIAAIPTYLDTESG
jgi:hypothetical protein